MSLVMSDSKLASKALFVERQGERADSCGIYLGRTRKYALPFLMDPDSLISPHMSVLGMTGSGKTYLLRAIAARSVMYSRLNVTLFDWSGEYSGMVMALGGKVLSCSKSHMPESISPWCYGPSGDPKGAIRSMDMSGAGSDGGAVRMATECLGAIADGMRSLGEHRRTRHLILVDESWKLFKGIEVASLFREARKYGFGIVAASQMANDITNSIISNSSLVAIFRMQNGSDFDVLRRSELVREDDIGTISKLGIGSCLMISKHRDCDGRPERAVIDKVSGVFERSRHSIWCGPMEFTIESGRFAEITGRMLGGGAAEAVRSFAGYDEEIDLVSFVLALRKLGVPRQDIVAYLRELGIPDKQIVLAYADAEALRAGG